VKYILSLSNEKANANSLPAAGSYTTKVPTGDKGQGVFILRASYEDQGNNGLPSLSSEQTYTLRNAKISPHGFDKYESAAKMSFGGNDFVIPGKSGSYIGLNQADLTGIQRVEMVVATPKAQLNAQGGNIELRLDSPTGKLIGESGFIEATDQGGFGGNAVKINLTPTEGIHDLYVVFQNPKAEGSLMVVMGIEFKTAASDAGTAPAATAAPANDLSAYAGKYKMTGLPFEYIEVKIKDSKVIMDAGGQGGEVSPTDTPDKFDADGKATVYFIRDEAAKVSKIKLEAMGMVFEGKKE
jgi:cytochrome c